MLSRYTLLANAVVVASTISCVIFDAALAQSSAPPRKGAVAHSSAPPRKSPVADTGPAPRKGNIARPGAVPRYGIVPVTGPTAVSSPPPQKSPTANTGAAPEKGQIARKGAVPIYEHKEGCQHHLSVGSDTLFEFDKYSLTPQAADTLNDLGPRIQKLGKHPLTVEGHTDSIGTDEYNQKLSEQRAGAVKDWLDAHHFIPGTASIIGYGKKKPVAPNTNPDGSDNPDGRQKNRRVEIVVDTCH